MKVGDYVRTINGIIAKIESKRDYTTGDYIGGENDFFLNVNHSYQDYDRIVKSSSNIIDLIEVGDIVKIEYQGWHQVSTKFETLKFFDDEGTEYLYDEIRAIITREQLESMEYKVGE